MLAVEPELAAVLSGGHHPISRVVSLWPDHSERAAWESGPDAVLRSGTVGCDLTRDVRRLANLGLANADGALTPYGLGDPLFVGSLIRIERGARIGLADYYAPMFTGYVTSFRATMRGDLAVSAADRLSLAAQDFGEVVTIQGGTGVASAVYRILSPALGAGDGSLWVLDDGSRTVGYTRTFAEDDKRLDAARSIALEAGCELFAYRNGEIVLRPLADPNTVAVTATHDRDPATSDILDLTRAGSAELYNAVVVIGERLTGPVLRARAAVTDPSHPLHPGRLGYTRTYSYRSAAIATQDQANAIAVALLFQLAVFEEAVDSGVVPDLRTDEGDLNLFVEPNTGTNNRYRLTTVSLPVVEGTMSLSSRRIESFFA